MNKVNPVPPAQAVAANVTNSYNINNMSFYTTSRHVQTIWLETDILVQYKPSDDHIYIRSIQFGSDKPYNTEFGRGEEAAHFIQYGRLICTRVVNTRMRDTANVTGMSAFCQCYTPCACWRIQ